MPTEIIAATDSRGIAKSLPPFWIRNKTTMHKKSTIPRASQAIAAPRTPKRVAAK